MKAISISITSNSFLVEKINLRFSKRENVNTNTFVNETLIYTVLFVKHNKKVVEEFLSSKNINSVIYKDFDSFMILSSIFNSINIKFDLTKSLTPKVMNELINNDYVKYIECYFMPSNFVKVFADNGVSIKFNNNMSFTSKFVSDNNLKNLMSIYYKKSIDFYNVDEVMLNLDAFLKVNSSLKFINLYCYSNEIIDYIIKLLEINGVKNVDIFLYQNEDNLSFLSSNAEYIRKVIKKYNSKIREFKIIYSESYIKDNFFRDLTFNGLKLVSVIVIYIGVVMMFTNKYHEYVALLNLRILESSLADTTIGDITIDDMDDTIINEEIDTTVPTEPNTEPPKEYVNHYASIQAQTFDKLLSINKDVVGWLKVNNTKVNYPVTHYTDNQYYLTHDIYNRNIMTGWVFMDYRNDPFELNHNTVIYGHNLITGYMFGDLKSTTNKDWYLNPDNQIITYGTLYKEMKWKIFSIYRTDYTTDYLKTSCFNDEQFMNFVNMIKGRSIYNFNVNVEPNDKILTLSTCTGSNNRRLAIHAVLLD